LARAGRVSPDLSEIIKRRPVELAALLLVTGGQHFPSLVADHSRRQPNDHPVSD